MAKPGPAITGAAPEIQPHQHLINPAGALLAPTGVG
jgi:hypothetical protein